MTIGQRIKARRQELGLSQQALASKLGMSGPGLYLIESGKTQRPRNLDKIAAVLKITVDSLESRRGRKASAPINGAAKTEKIPARVIRLAQSLSQLHPTKLKALFVLAGVK